MACWILVPPQWVEPVSPAVEAWNPSYWTTRKFPGCNMVERGLGIFVFSAVSAHIPRKLLGKLFGDSGSISMFDTPQEKYEISQERNP